MLYPEYARIYPINCPVCDRENRYSLMAMTTKQRVNCSRWRCPSIKVRNYYDRSKLEDLVEKLGLPLTFTGVNDSFDPIEQEKGMLEGAREEEIAMGLV